MIRSLLALVALAGTLTACQDVKGALTAHTNVAARAGSQELSVSRLASLLANSEAPVNTDIARRVAEVWVDYQLLATAAARGDSLRDPKVVDAAMWPVIAQARANKFMTQALGNATGADTAGAAARYAAGDLLAAQHILITVPQTATPAQRAVARQKAESLRARVTSSNFAELARANSQDPGSAQRGGQLGVFPRGAMVPAFEQALLALQPGQISPVVQTQFGYHIIRRPTYAEIRDEFNQAVLGSSMQAAESTYVAQLQQTSNLAVPSNAAATVRAVAKDPEGNLDNKTPIATANSGPVTAGRLAEWITAMPQKEQIRQGVESAPDSLLNDFARRIATQELILRKADSAKVALDTSEVRQLRASFAQMVDTRQQALGLTPAQLADSARAQRADSGAKAAPRAQVAAERASVYLDSVLAGKSRFVDVPYPVEQALRDAYPWKINQSGLARAVQQANKLRAARDSSRTSSQPPTQVPMGPPVKMQGQPAAPAPSPPDTSGAR